MTERLLARAREFFSRSSRCEDGRRAISRFRHVVQFKLDGKPVFWGRASGGTVRLRNGRTPRPDLTFDTDIRTYDAIFNDVLTPTDAWFTGVLKLPGFGLRRVGYARLLSLIRICQGRYFWRH